MKISNSIDNLYLYNYSKILETNDLRYLFILPDYFELPKTTDKEMQQLFEIWEKINDEVLDFVGISEDYKEQFRLRKTIALLKVEMICKEDKSLQTIIDIKERELLNMMPKQKQTVDESIIAIEVNLKMQINPKDTTVKKYFSYIKYLSKKNNK